MAHSDSDSDVSIPVDSSTIPLYSNAPNNRSVSFTSNLDAKGGNRRPQQHYADDADGHDNMNANNPLLISGDTFSSIVGHRDNARDHVVDAATSAADKYLESPLDSPELGLLGRPRQSFDSTDSGQGFHEFKWRRALGRLAKRCMRHLMMFFVRTYCYFLAMLLAAALFVFIFFADIKQSMYGIPDADFVSIFFCPFFCTPNC